MGRNCFVNDFINTYNTCKKVVEKVDEQTFNREGYRLINTIKSKVVILEMVVEHKLTFREKRILNSKFSDNRILVNREIADVLGISEITVSRNLKSINAKFEESKDLIKELEKDLNNLYNTQLSYSDEICKKMIVY